HASGPPHMASGRDAVAPVLDDYAALAQMMSRPLAARHNLSAIRPGHHLTEGLSVAGRPECRRRSVRRGDRRRPFAPDIRVQAYYSVGAGRMISLVLTPSADNSTIRVRQTCF